MLSKILKLLLMVMILDYSSAAQQRPQSRSTAGRPGRGGNGGGGYNGRPVSRRGPSYSKGGRSQDPLPYFHPHNNPNEPNYGPIMISTLPVIPNSAADYGGGRSMNAYLAQVDRELAIQSSERQRPRQRSLLRKDGWIETQQGEEFNIPLQTASPDIPPDVIDYFEKARKNDLALAAAIQKAENDKIEKEMYWVRNKADEKPWKQVEVGEEGSQPGRGRSLFGKNKKRKSGKNGGSPSRRSKMGKNKQRKMKGGAKDGGDAPPSRRNKMGKNKDDKKDKDKEKEDKKDHDLDNDIGDPPKNVKARSKGKGTEDKNGGKQDKANKKDDPKQRSVKGKPGSKDKRQG